MGKLILALSLAVVAHSLWANPFGFAQDPQVPEVPSKVSAEQVVLLKGFFSETNDSLMALIVASASAEKKAVVS